MSGLGELFLLGWRALSIFQVSREIIDPSLARELPLRGLSVVQLRERLKYKYSGVNRKPPRDGTFTRP